MKAVVVGGQGFIGAAVVEELLRRGTGVTVMDRNASAVLCDELFGRGAVQVVRGDIMDAERLVDGFTGADEIYHMAGKLGTSELESDIRQAIDINIVGAINVFEAAARAGVETVFYPAKPNVWLNAYTVTKYASEQFARLYSQNHSIRICGLRYFNAYGPRQALYPVRKIIPAFAAEAMCGLPLTVFGSGEQTVDMIYSADLGRITVEFVRSGSGTEVLDCGRGVAMSVNEVAAAVNDHFGNPAGVRRVPMRRGEDPDTMLVADVAPLERVIGPLQAADWGDSLRQTLDWYANQEKSEISLALATYRVA